MVSTSVQKTHFCKKPKSTRVWGRGGGLTTPHLSLRLFRINLFQRESFSKSYRLRVQICYKWNDQFLEWNNLVDHTVKLYVERYIYNADDFGLFCQCLPDHLTGEKCSEGKKSRVRVTGIGTASATGENLPIFIISKSRNPRCFENVKQLPCK